MSDLAPFTDEQNNQDLIAKDSNQQIDGVEENSAQEDGSEPGEQEELDENENEEGQEEEEEEQDEGEEEEDNEDEEEEEEEEEYEEEEEEEEEETETRKHPNAPTMQVKTAQQERVIRETSPLLRMRFKMESDRRDELKNRKVQDAFDLLINPVKQKEQEGLNFRRKRNNSFDANKSSLIPLRIYDFKVKEGTIKKYKSNLKLEDEWDISVLNEFKPKVSVKASSSSNSTTTNSSPQQASPPKNAAAQPSGEGRLRRPTMQIVPVLTSEQIAQNCVTSYFDIVRNKTKHAPNKNKAYDPNYIFKKRPGRKNEKRSDALILPSYLDIIDGEERQFKYLQSLPNPGQHCLVTHNPFCSDYQIKSAEIIDADMLVAPFGKMSSLKRMSAIAMSINYIIIASSHNRFYIYGVEDEDLIESLNLEKEIGNSATPTCMDISEDEEFLAIGTSDGTILIWNLPTLTKQFKIREHKVPVISVRIFNQKPVSIISSDTDGNTMKATFKREFMMQQVENYWIFKRTSPVTNVILLNREIQNIFNEMGITNVTGARNNEVIAALASLDGVYIIVVEPVVRVLFKEKKPAYIKKDCYPCITWANGVFNSKRKKVNNYLVVAWSNFLYLIELSSIGAAASFEMVGHLPLDVDGTIIYIGWISTSLLFIVDDLNTFMIVSLESFIQGKYIDQSNQIRPLINSSASSSRRSSISTEDNFNYERPIQAKHFSKVFKYRESLKIQILNQKSILELGNFHGLHNTIVVNRKKHCAITLMGNSIKKVHLMTWEEYLDQLVIQDEWLLFLTLAVDIFNEDLKEVSDVPLKKEEKHEKMHFYFRNKILKFISTKINSKIDFQAQKRFVSQVISCVIDACLKLNLHEFLFDKVWLTFNSLGLEEEFLRNLENFIEMGKIDYMPLATLEKLVQKYKEKYSKREKAFAQKKRIVELLLMSLSLNRYDDIQEIIQFIKKERFLLSLIEVCLFNNDKMEYFSTPLAFLMELYKSEQRKGAAQVEKTAYKTFWFLRQCFQCSPSFNNKTIIPYKWELILLEVLKFLFAETFAINLMEIDTQLVINLLLLLYREDTAKLIQNRYGTFTLQLFEMFECPDELYSSLKGNTHFQIFWMFTQLMLQRTVENEAKYLGLLGFFYSSIIELKNYDHFFLDKELCIRITRFLLSHPNAIHDNVIVTSFKFDTTRRGVDLLDQVEALDHSFIFKQKANISLRLIKFIEKDLDEAKIQDIINESKDSPMLEVTSYLHFLLNNSKSSLTAYLENPQYINMFDDRVFEWIDFLLEKLRNTEDHDSLLKEIKAYILRKIHILFGANIQKTRRLISRYFRDSTRTIIKMLMEHPNEFKGFMDNIFDSAIRSGKVIPVKAISEDALLAYINLLCESKDRDDHEKLAYCINNYDYPLEDCLELCQESNLKEAWAYIEEQTENYYKALQLRYDIFYEKLQEFINNSQTDLKDKVLEELATMLNILKETSEEESRKLSLWTLNKLLKLSEELTSYDNIPIEVVLLSQHIERAMETVLYESVMTFSTTKILEQIIKDIPHVHFLKSFYDGLISNNQHEGHVKDAVEKIMGEEICMNTNRLKFEGIRGWTLQKRCSLCKKGLKIEQDFAFFACGHVFHRPSCMKGSECLFCEKTESDIIQKYMIPADEDEEEEEGEREEEAAEDENEKTQEPEKKKKETVEAKSDENEKEKDDDDDEEEDIEQEEQEEEEGEEENEEQEEQEEEEEDEDEEEEYEEEEEHQDGEEGEDGEFLAAPGMRKYYQRMFKFQAYGEMQEQSAEYLYDTLVPKLGYF